MQLHPNDAQIAILRLAFPQLLDSLSEEALAGLRPHVIWEWVDRAGGEVLFREGAPSDSLYVVLSGRLQASVAGPDGKSEVVGEIGRGETVGEMGAFTDEPRRATVTAVRDSLLARIEIDAFRRMLEACPNLALGFNRVIIERLQKRNVSQKPVHNLINLAVLPITAGVGARSFLEDLVTELKDQKQTALHLTSEMVDTAAGRPNAAQATDAEPDAHRWLMRYLDELESRFSLVFYEADETATPWTQRCLRQCDEVLLLGDASAAPDLTEVESRFLQAGEGTISARQTIVLRHRADAVWATGTPEFLAARPKVYRHFQLRDGCARDLARLARFLSGRAVGLVFAGGGARGLAHIGVYRALEEAGVPIDAIGGTSIGSVLGACIACDWRSDRLFSENRREFLDNPTRDLNLLPFLSVLTGRKLSGILERGFPGTMIEELWLPFFCVSSSFTRAREVVHKRGNLKRALLASMAIPGIFPPVVEKNELLLDGGLFNNLPVDVMARSGVRHIIAVDLSGKDTGETQAAYEEIPSRWALFVDLLRPKLRRRYAFPSLVTTLIASSMLNSQQKTAQVIGDVDLLLKPDVEDFGLLEWRSYDAICERGYEHAKEVLAGGLPF